ncbi:unnamed protein product [Prunus armeniaca]
MGGQPMFLYNPFVILYLGFTNAPTLTDPASPEPNGFLVLPQNLSRPKLVRKETLLEPSDLSC